MKKDERVLIYPAIYKHFKGKDYATMGVSRPLSAEKLTQVYGANPVSKILMHAEHTEMKKTIAIFSIDGEWFHLKDDCNKGVVLYKSLYDNHGVYCRDIEMFMSEVDGEREDNVTKQKYRFELVEY